MNERTVGVLERDDAKMQTGLTLLCAGRETYLLDEDGREVHRWRAPRPVFAAYLLPSGNLLRDGSESIDAPSFQAGGAAGVVEEVTWDGEVVWSWAALPYEAYLTHHDLEPMPNGNVLVMCWERKTKEQAIAAGRRPDLLPDGELWNNLIIELKPDLMKKTAREVWRWSAWDHLVQDFDAGRANFGDVWGNPGRVDINYAPAGGKSALRNRDLLLPEAQRPGNPSGLVTFRSKAQHTHAVSGTGEKDWLHANSVSYDAARELVLIGVNIFCEVWIVDHATSTAVAATAEGGRRGKGGEILCRFGNPRAHRGGGAGDQTLYTPHSPNFVADADGGDCEVLLFNNGRAPDRLWSTVEQWRLPSVALGHKGLGYEPDTARDPTAKPTLTWKYGPGASRRDSFYCTHISGCQRLPNGNTLVTLGPQGIVFEVTAAGEHVWRYVSPVQVESTAVSVTRQGDQRLGYFSLFRALRYPLSALPEHIVAGLPEESARRHLEA